MTGHRDTGRDPSAKELAQAEPVAALHPEQQRSHPSAVVADPCELVHIWAHRCACRRVPRMPKAEAERARRTVGRRVLVHRVSVGAYAYYDARQVAHTAIDLLEREIGIESIAMIG